MEKKTKTRSEILSQDTLKTKVDTPWRRRLRSISSNPLAMTGFVIIVLWILIAIFAPLIATQDPFEQKIEDRLTSPTSQYLFGTDELGRDIFSRVIYGARISLPIGLFVILFAVVFWFTYRSLSRIFWRDL